MPRGIAKNHDEKRAALRKGAAAYFSRHGFDRASIAEIGVGSGCLSVALLRNLPEAKGVAVDISPGAIEVARANAERHHVDQRLELREGDLLAPLDDRKGELHYLVSNPPYIPDHEWDAVEPNVKDHEPVTALRAGPDGLQFVRPLIENAHHYLQRGGLLAIEIAASTRTQALELARANTELLGPRVEDDTDALPRVLVATRK